MVKNEQEKEVSVLKYTLMHNNIDVAEIEIEEDAADQEVSKFIDRERAEAIADQVRERINRI